MHQKYIPEDGMRKKSWKPQKNGEYIFLVADGSANLSGRVNEFQEPTLRREYTVKREEFRPEETKDDEQINKDFWVRAEARKIVIILNREVQSSAERRIIPYFTRFTLLNETPPRRNFRCGRGMERSQNIWGKKTIICWYCRERTEFCTLFQLCARIRSDEKISRKLFTFFFLWRWKQAHVVSSRGTAFLSD